MRRSFWLVTLVGAGLAAIAAVSADSDAAPLSLALALVSLAAWGAVLVLRRIGRRIVSVLGVLAAATAGISGIVEAPGAVGGWLPVLASAVLFAVAFVLAPQWPEMSARYDAGGGAADEGRDRARAVPTDPWKAIDQGHDPTV